MSNLNNSARSFCHCNANLFTVISGSYRKHLNQITRIKLELESRHIAVLSPSGSIAINPDEEFVILDSDPVSHPKLLQDSVFAKIRRSSFLVVANVNGYLGAAAIMEIGYAIAIGLTIYTLEPVEDPNLSPYCELLTRAFPDLNIHHFQDHEIASVDLSTTSHPINTIHGHSLNFSRIREKPLIIEDRE